MKFTYDTNKTLPSQNPCIHVVCQVSQTTSRDFQLEPAALFFLFPPFEDGAVVDLAETRCDASHGGIGACVSSLLLLACF
jgi:hypothetical protein